MEYSIALIILDGCVVQWQSIGAMDIRKYIWCREVMSRTVIGCNYPSRMLCSYRTFGSLCNGLTVNRMFGSGSKVSGNRSILNVIDFIENRPYSSLIDL